MARSSWTVARVVGWIFYVIIILLVVRFILVLLGVDQTFAIDSWLFQLTSALASPFRGIIPIPDTHLVWRSVLEWTTLIIVVVYAVIRWLLVKLLVRLGV